MFVDEDIVSNKLDNLDSIFNDKTKGKISWSQYKLYAECPHKWYLQYKMKASQQTDSIHTIFGTAIHETIQLYVKELYEKNKTVANAIDLDDVLRKSMKKTYDDIVELWKTKHVEGSPCTKQDMLIFYKHGIEILREFKKEAKKYFDPKKTGLVGIELPVYHEYPNNVVYVGLMDIVIKDKKTNKYIIIDIKTSTKSWDDRKKKDKALVNQLVAYKIFYAEMLGIDADDIDVYYLITKRTIAESSDFKISRLQKFSPSNGSRTQKEVRSQLQSFVDSAFDETGGYKDYEQPKQPDTWVCRFCPFATQWKYSVHSPGNGMCNQNGKIFVIHNDKWQ